MIDSKLPMTANEVLDREFLEIRAKVLEIAASFDRLGRADGDVSGDPRLSLVVEAMKTVMDNGSDRAERVQKIFSREYHQDWRKTFEV